MKTERIFPVNNILCSDAVRQYQAEEQAILSNFKYLLQWVCNIQQFHSRHMKFVLPKGKYLKVLSMRLLLENGMKFSGADVTASCTNSHPSSSDCHSATHNTAHNLITRTQTNAWI